MDQRYCVRFIRCDGAIPNVENYYYWDLVDAENHFEIFNAKDPDFPKMYDKIQLINIYGNLSTIRKEICFH